MYKLKKKSHGRSALLFTAIAAAPFLAGFHSERQPVAPATLAGPGTTSAQGIYLAGAAKRCPELYAIDSVCDRLLKIDLSTMVAEEVGNLGTDIGATGIDISANGTLWGVFASNGVDYVGTVNKRTGALVLGAQVSVLLGSRGVAMAPDCSSLLVADEMSSTLYSVDMATGQAVSIGGGGLGLKAASLGRSPLGYFTVDLAADTLNRVSPITGDALSSTLFPLGLSNVRVGALAFEPNTGQLFAWDNEQNILIQIDPLTNTSQSLGGLTFPGGCTGQIGGMAFENTDFTFGK